MCTDDQAVGAPGEDAASSEQGSYIDVQTTDSGSDSDSAFGGSDAESITTSMKSHLFNYVYENGRRYHARQSSSEDDDYMFPNDEKEQDRLDMLHHIFLLVQQGNLYTAPITEPPARVLDMGTGTGLWAMDMADRFPDAHVMGNDLTPIQPTWVPPNCEFLVDDLEKEWAYPPNKHFDYVHQRSMAGSIGDWPGLYKQAFENIVPGGWYEIQEFDVWFHSQVPGGLKEDSAIAKWQKLVHEASSIIARPLNCAEGLDKPLEEAGFTNIQRRVYKTPIGGWPKDPKLREIGLFLQLQMQQALEAVTLAYFTRILQWKEEEVQVFLAQVRNEFNTKSLLLYTYCRFTSGQKPTVEST